MSEFSPTSRRVIRRDGTEVRQVVQHAIDCILESNRRTVAALRAEGFDEADLNRMILDWWEKEALGHLNGLAEQFIREMTEVDAWLREPEEKR